MMKRESPLRLLNDGRDNQSGCQLQMERVQLQLGAIVGRRRSQLYPPMPRPLHH